jgi:hypothetical protein
MTNYYGELLDVKDIVVSHAGNSSICDARDEGNSNPKKDTGDNPFGALIHHTQVVPSRRRKYKPRTKITREDYYRIRQGRSDNGRLHGEEYEFELTPEQKAQIDRWHEIYEAEIAEDTRRFNNRMKRNNNEGRRKE